MIVLLLLFFFFARWLNIPELYGGHLVFVVMLNGLMLLSLVLWVDSRVITQDINTSNNFELINFGIHLSRYCHDCAESDVKQIHIYVTVMAAIMNQTKSHKGDFWGLYGIRLVRYPGIIPE